MACVISRNISTLHTEPTIPNWQTATIYLMLASTTNDDLLNPTLIIPEQKKLWVQVNETATQQRKLR